MSQNFVDASAWLALWSERDEFHGEAAVYFRSHRPPLVVTSISVMAEVFSLLRRRRGVEMSADVCRKFFQDSTVSVEMHLDQDLAEASRLFCDGSRDASFTDCLTVALMRRLGLREIFTFDQWFAQQGLTMVPGGKGMDPRVSEPVVRYRRRTKR